MRLLTSRRLGLALLGMAAIALSPSAFAQDPLAPPPGAPDGSQAIAPAPSEGQATIDPAAAAPAPTDGQVPAADPAAAAPPADQQQPAVDPATAAPAPPTDAQPPTDPAAAAAPPTDGQAPPPGDAPAAPPADAQPPADPAAAAPPADAQPPADPAAATPADAAPPVDPAAAPPADPAPAPPADAAPPADPAPAAPATDGPAPPEPPPPPPAADATEPGATPAVTPTDGQAGQAGWGWEAQCIGQYLQCGGLNYWGPTNCCEGHQCEYVNDYWWQCNPIPDWVPPARPAQPAAPAEPTLAPTRHPHHWGHHHHHSTEPTIAPTPFPTEAGPPFWEQECFRVRKNILNLTPEELADFIEALQVLKANGVYDSITAIHGDPKTFGLFHGNDYFLPWHRWYVLKIETEIRNLGGKWACFAMPYWDWTLDAGREMESPIWNIFGPMGKKNDSFCMREGPWAEWKNNKGGCLKRIGSDSYRFFSPAEVMDLILNKEKLVNGFRPAFEAGAHSRPHLFIGGAMNSFASPDDPIFWLHHSMVDKVWAMWQDCHALFDPANIAPEMFKPEEVDVELAFAPGITARSVWSVKDLGYTYETDIMSAYTFLNVCHWFHLKPNPGIDLNIPAPPMPELPPESRFGPVPSGDGVPHPPPAVSPAIADGADTAVPPPPPTENKADEGGVIEGIIEEQQAATPNLRGHKGKGGAAAAAPTPKPKDDMDGKGNDGKSGKSKQHKHKSKPSIASTRASAFFPPAPQLQQPVEATKEWAVAQAAVAPFAPHGKGLIVEENRIFVSCMEAVADGRAEGMTKADCMQAVLRRDCEMLGYICDLPRNYREGMFAAEAEAVFKKGNLCARTCSPAKTKAADMDISEMGMRRP